MSDVSQGPAQPAAATKDPSGRRKPVLVLVGLALLAIAVVAVAACGGSKTSSDEDQIKALIQTEQTAFNNVDYNAYLQTLCAQGRSQAESQTTWVDNNKASLDAYGPIEFTVTNIKVTGDTATADMATKGEKQPESRRTTDTAQFVREDGAWKDCTAVPPSG